MNVGQIIKDSLKYPFSDWKKFLILGIIILITVTYDFVWVLGFNNILIWYILFTIGLIIQLLVVVGYQFRIIKSTLAGADELPVFNNWISMFSDGFKVKIVEVVYSIPVILLVLIFAKISYASILWSTSINPTNIPYFEIVVKWLLIAFLYKILIYPIFRIAIAHMANNESKLGSAFKLREILNKIGNVGWGKLIIWYIAVGFIFIILLIIGDILAGLLGLISLFLGIIFLYLVIMPYLYIFVSRSTALIYKSDEKV